MRKNHKRFFYAFLISLVLHGVIIFIWPRMRVPVEGESLPFAYVSLIEKIHPLDIKIEQPPSPKNESDLNRFLKEGRRLIENIIENINKRDFDISPPPVQIRLPKQLIQPEAMEYVKIWPEELRYDISGDMEKIPLPQAGKEHKAPFVLKEDTGIMASLFKQEFPEESLSKKPYPEITWEGKPRQWLTRPKSTPTYRGEEEGVVKLRFWVDEYGEVVNAVPIKKLTPELEEKALNYLFSWRFESVPGTELQEGIIRINFRLQQQPKQ